MAALYYLGLAFLFTHELDAVTHAEWRLLFVLRSFPDSVAEPWFVSLHVPLFFAILWLSHARSARLRGGTRLAVSIFFAVHAALHFALSARKEYEFEGALSNALILGAALCGVAYLALLWRHSRPLGDHAA